MQNVPDRYVLYQLENEADDPTLGYKMSPKAIGEAVASQVVWEEDITIWHTHPGGLVGPSRLDLATMVERCRYMVVAIPTGEVNYFGAPPIFER